MAREKHLPRSTDQSLFGRLFGNPYDGFEKNSGHPRIQRIVHVVKSEYRWRIVMREQNRNEEKEESTFTAIVDGQRLPLAMHIFIKEIHHEGLS